MGTGRCSTAWWCLTARLTNRQPMSSEWMFTARSLPTSPSPMQVIVLLRTGMHIVFVASVAEHYDEINDVIIDGPDYDEYHVDDRKED